jgi:hypothetical protein
MNVTAVQPKDVAPWINRLAWHFDEFTKSGVLTKQALWADVKSKQRQLFVVTDGDVKAAVLTRISDDELQSCVVTHAAGYDRASWQHLFPVLSDWAKSIGCKRLEAITRVGWERPLKEYGLKKTHVVLEMEL